MAINKKDFIEIEFTGVLTDTGEIFDTNEKKNAKLANIKEDGLKPMILSVGFEMLPIGFDEDLIGKEEGKDYSITLNPEKAFGKRQKELVQMVPTKYFLEQNINPVRGMQLNLDGRLARVLSSDRGRTLIDLNNPLASKKITYNYKILRKVNDEKEKINSLQEFFFRQSFEFEKKENKVILKVPKELEQFVKMLSSKFKEMLGLELDTQIIEKKKEDKK